MRRLRFDSVPMGHVIEHKGMYYLKLANPVRLTSSLKWNAVTLSNGGLFNFLTYEEVNDCGPFKPPASLVVRGK